MINDIDETKAPLIDHLIELRQRLMELDSPLMRLELVSDLLARTGITG